MTVLMGGALGGLVGIGALCVVVGVAGVPFRSPIRDRDARLPDRALLRASVGVAALVVATSLTGWIVVGLMCGAAAAYAPGHLGSTRRRRAALERTEAVASWAEMLRDTMAAAAGIQEAIGATAAVAPVPIRSEIQSLAGRIDREPLVPSLREFAEAVCDPTADMVVAALTVASQRQARNLGELLSAAASSARATATMRMKVEASRARTYTSTRMILAITGLFAVGLLVFNRGYLAPFGTPVGQLVLLLIGGVFGVALWSMSLMGATAKPDRFLAPHPQAIAP